LGQGAIGETIEAAGAPANVKNMRRYRPDDKLLAFLKGL